MPAQPAEPEPGVTTLSFTTGTGLQAHVRDAGSQPLAGRDKSDGNERAGFALARTTPLERRSMLFLERLLLHYGIYRRYPLRRWPAFKNACRIVFR